MTKGQSHDRMVLTKAKQRSPNKGVLNGNMSHNKLITNIAAFDAYFSSQLLDELEDDAPNVLAQTRVGEAEVERSHGSDGHVGVHDLEAEEECGTDGDTGVVGGRGEAAEGELDAVDAGGEGGVVAGGEGVGGVGEEGGGDRGGAVVEDGELKGNATAAAGCLQRQWVLADQELEQGGVAVGVSSLMKGRVHTVTNDRPGRRVDRSRHRLRGVGSG